MELQIYFVRMYIHISVNWAVLATLVALVLAQRSPVYENGARKSGKRGIPGGLAGLPPDIAATMPLDSTDRSADLEDQQSIQSGAVVTITETVIVRASSIRAQDSSTVFSTSSVYAMSSSLADQAFEQHTSATSSPVAIDASSCCDTQPLSTSSLLSGPWGSDCPTNPFDKTDMPHYFGLNVVNSKPGDPNDAIKLKQPEDWDAAFALIKQYFGTINAVRIYSTTDGATYHLMNALPAAQKYDLKILAGVWSGGPENLVRFEREKKALRDAITEFGCGNIAAISVGNEDLNQVNVLQTSDPDSVKDQAKEKVAETLISQITQIRNVTRSLGCCNTPITHTDTWNELFDTKRPWLPGVSDHKNFGISTDPMIVDSSLRPSRDCQHIPLLGAVIDRRVLGDDCKPVVADSRCNDGIQ